MIRKENDVFILETSNTTYCFRVLETGHLEHLYYGRRLRLPKGDGVEALIEKQVTAPGCTCTYDKEHPTFTLEDIRLEASSLGRGDMREPFVEVVHADGSYSSNFVFESAQIQKGKPESDILPGSYDESGEVDRLCVMLKDREYDVALELNYYVYPDCDVITRNARVINNSSETIKLLRLLSLQMDFGTADYMFTTFNGGWGREMKRNDVQVSSGKHVNATYAGVSSCQANPFVMLSREKTTEDSGECYGFNLIYSGNHYEAVSVNSFGKTRFVTGINPQSFCFVLEPGATFEAPEAVMTYSHLGFNEMSGHMHQFVREHIIRGEWKDKVRPILLNSWEASYFDINEEKLLRLAKAGKDAGVELFVMDDGWFGERNDDFTSLGDWDVNTKKLPNGVSGLCEKVKALGLDFGIWVEPEMINVQSKLYEAHPDWVLQIPGKPHSEGRNQRLLDLTKTEVQDFIIEKMSEVFSQADISYVKWDMNRSFTDYFSDALPAECQGEVAHRYVLGLYRCMKELTKRFPKILFEGCASGGNRFDLGILCYFPQIWGSDDTDALCRAEIQNGYSYGYPLSTVSAHVSVCPNHQTQRMTPLETRFHVACFGSFGYECNLCEMNETELAAVKEQIALYKQWREVLQKGRFYRGRSFHGNLSALVNSDSNHMEWTCVSPDQKKAVGMLMQRLVVPNVRNSFYRAKGLEEDVEYHFYNGQTVADPSVKADDESENLYAYGDTLMYAGVYLNQPFALGDDSCGNRHYQDWGSRIYFMEAEE